MLIVEHDERIRVLHVPQVGVLLRLQVEDHEVCVIDWPVVGAGGNIGDAVLLIGHDADDAMLRPGDAKVFVLAGLRIVRQDIAALVKVA